MYTRQRREEGEAKRWSIEGDRAKLLERDKQIKVQGAEWIERSLVGATEEVME